MNWIVASALMFFSSVCMYLLVRRCAMMKVPQELQNIAMFLIPLVFYLPLSFFLTCHWL
ncbi:hypothetical protein HY947_05940 [Candidatus Gottesmanbacteria bacterium]|nr:hypothetical protein [Candidatus Gottesmanbacteria bacterium]